MTRFKFEGSLSSEEAAQLTKYHLKRGGYLNLFLLVVGILFGFLGIVTFAVAGDGRALFVYACLGTTIALIHFSRLLKNLIAYKNNPYLDMVNTVEITDEFVRFRNGIESVESCWSKVRDVHDMGTGIVVVADRMTFFLPNRVFTNTAGKMDLLDFAQSNRDSGAT